MNKALEDLQAGRDPFRRVEPADDGALFYRCARLSFWVPIGMVLFCVGVANCFNDVQNQTARTARLVLLGVVGLSLVIGMVLGLIGLCGIPRHGASGLVGPAVRGLAASGGILWLTLTGYLHGIQNVRAMTKVDDTLKQVDADIKKSVVDEKDPHVAMQKTQLGIDRFKLAMDTAASDSSGPQSLVAKAFSAHASRMQALMKDYAGAMNAILEPSVYDMSGVTQRSQLQTKKDLVKRLMTANDKLEAFIAKRQEYFAQDLDQARVPEATKSEATRGYARAANRQDPLLLKIREQDRRMGNATLAMLDLLDANWGKWTYNAERKKVYFQDTAAQSKMMDYRDEVESAAREQRKLQLQLASLPAVA